MTGTVIRNLDSFWLDIGVAWVDKLRIVHWYDNSNSLIRVVINTEMQSSAVFGL